MPIIRCFFNLVLLIFVFLPLKGQNSLEVSPYVGYSAVDLKNTDNGPVFGISGSCYFSRILGIEISYLRTQLDYQENDLNTEEFDLDTFGIFLTSRLKYNENWRFRIKAGVTDTQGKTDIFNVPQLKNRSSAYFEYDKTQFAAGISTGYMFTNRFSTAFELNYIGEDIWSYGILLSYNY